MTSHYITEFVLNHLLKYLRYSMIFTFHRVFLNGLKPPPPWNNCIFIWTSAWSFLGKSKTICGGEKSGLPKHIYLMNNFHFEFQLHSFQMSPWRTHCWLKDIYLCFSRRESRMEFSFFFFFFYRSQISRSSWVGSTTPEKSLVQN